MTTASSNDILSPPSTTAASEAKAAAGTALPGNAPTTAALLAIWQETLGASDGGLDENFFDAGGTSLLAARLAARIKAQLGCQVSAADILSHPSVRLLGKKLSGKEAAFDREATDRRAAMQRRAFPSARPAGKPGKHGR